MDSDDIMHEDRLAKLIKTFEKTGADFIQTGFDAFDHETKDVVMKNLGKPNANQYELALEGRFWANTIRASISKTLAENIGPWKTDMMCFEDREYMERAVSNAKKPVAIKDVLASARRGGSQRVSQKLRSYEGRKLRIYCEKQLLSYLSLHPNVNKKVLRKFANRILTLGVRSNTNGWNDLAMECVEIYRLTNTKLTMKDLVKTQMIRYGKVLPKINAWLVFKVLRLKK